MALPVTATWDLFDFNESNISTLVGLGPSDISASPTLSPYITYDPDTNLLVVQGSDGVDATADFNTAVPSRHTFEVIMRFVDVPPHSGYLDRRRVGFSVVDDSSYGMSLFFAENGIAAGEQGVESATPLPDTADDVTTPSTAFTRIRVATDGGLGRSYVFIGDEGGPLDLRYILPAFGDTAADLARIFVTGTATEPVRVEYKALRLASDLLVPNTPPVSDAGEDQVVTSGLSVRLDGRASRDPEGNPLSYSWTSTDVPYGSQYAGEGTGSTTDDGDSDGFTDTLTFSEIPSWLQSGDVLVLDNSVHVIDIVGGSTLTLETDTLPDNLSGVPFRVIDQSVLSDPLSDIPYITTDVPGIYRFELVVSDGEVESEAAKTVVNAVQARAPFGLEPDPSILWNALGDEWDLVENRDLFTELWRAASQVLGGKLLEAWQHHYNYSIRDAQGTFQRKWVPFRTLVPETEPSTVEVLPRYGILRASHDFSTGNPAVTGLTLSVHRVVPAAELTEETVDVVLGSDTDSGIVQDINAALTGIEAESVTHNGSTYVVLRSTTTTFRVSGNAAASLGFPSAYNYLSGSQGSAVTDRVYRVNPGVDLSAHGVRRGDLLSINNGQSYRIERVINDASDPTSNQRVLLSVPLPFDASDDWEIPSVIRSSTDYEKKGSYPGDLVRYEVYDTDQDTYHDGNAVVVTQRSNTLGVRLEDLFSAVLDSKYELRFLGLKRRKAVPVDAETISVPRLQDVIPQSENPEIWHENQDYYLEPFYREDDETGIPMLQFRDSVFIDSDTEPPDIFWAELVLFSNEPNIENLFGTLVNFRREDSDLSYPAAVSGLLYARQRGPVEDSLRIGTQILLGQPISEVRGTIVELRTDYSPTQGRILIQDDDGYEPSRTDVVRSYLYRKDPNDTSATSGLEINPDTGSPYGVGDSVEQFAPLASGVALTDYINTPEWFLPYVRAGVMDEIEKFHVFLAEFNLDLVSLANVSLLYQFLFRVRPTWKKPLIVGLREHFDDLDIVDSLSMTANLNLYDSLCGSGFAYRYDDFRGSGETWVDYGDPGVHYDQGIDCPLDTVEICITSEWPGGTITYDSFIFVDHEITDVDGAHTGTPGSTFVPTYGMSLAAGTYERCIQAKSGGVVT